jgi:hypothetical protein
MKNLVATLLIFSAALPVLFVAVTYYDSGFEVTDYAIKVWGAEPGQGWSDGTQHLGSINCKPGADLQCRFCVMDGTTAARAYSQTLDLSRQPFGRPYRFDFYLEPTGDELAVTVLQDAVRVSIPKYDASRMIAVPQNSIGNGGWTKYNEYVDVSLYEFCTLASTASAGETHVDDGLTLSIGTSEYEYALRLVFQIAD